jgi:hypothetical protein
MSCSEDLLGQWIRCHEDMKRKGYTDKQQSKQKPRIPLANTNKGS